MKEQRTEVAVRAIGPEDAEAVAQLCIQLGYPRTGEEIGFWMERSRVRSATQAVFVAVLSERGVVGWIEVSLVANLQTPEYALIGGLVVRDGVRGLGVGRRLCEAAESWGWAMGAETVRVTSRSSRESAHRFYLRDGYQQIKTSLVFEKRRP